MAEVVLVIEGIRELSDDMANLPKKVELALQRAMNRTADQTRTRLSRMIRQDVNLTASDLSPGGKRLFVSQRASAKNGAMQIRISGRGTPTSLARFAGNQRRPKVRVKRGAAARHIPGTFIINLRNGNTGLAMRSEERPQNAYKPRQMKNGLWLLYGPSIDQILLAASRDNGAFADVEPWARDKLEAEFWRLMGVEI